MKNYILLCSLFITAVIESKPVDRSSNSEVTNEIDYGNSWKKKNDKPDSREKFSRQMESSHEQPENSIDVNTQTSDVTTKESSTIKPQQNNNVPNLSVPLWQRWKFLLEKFFPDRLNQLKHSLENLGLGIPSNNATASKQFATTNGIVHLLGLNDPGFYTDRFEPAGFLGGNGWFANKGGILGGPGAIISTGSLLTDYPTPYKK